MDPHSGICVCMCVSVHISCLLGCNLFIYLFGMEADVEASTFNLIIYPDTIRSFCVPKKKSCPIPPIRRQRGGKLGEHTNNAQAATPTRK